jgi:hypothetical protein
MAFDPNHPFEVVDQPKAAPTFDPSQPFDVVGAPATAVADVPTYDPQVVTPDAGPPQIQAMSPEDQARTGQVGFEPNAATAGTEPTPLAEALRANVQPMLEHPIRGMESMFTNWDDLAHLYQQPQDIAGPTLKRFAGYPVSPEEEIGSQNFYNTGVGAALAAGAMRGSPIEEIRKALSPEDVKPAEQPPEAPVNAPESPVARSDAQAGSTPQEPAKVEPQTQRYQQSEPTEQEVQAANATGPEPAPAPEEATEPAPSVREALSLDELRLMRERNDLRLSADIAKRATGSVPGVIDERISAINDELDNIANQHLDTTQAVPEGAFDTLREPLNLEVPEFKPQNEPRPADQAVEQQPGQQPAPAERPVGVEGQEQPDTGRTDNIGVAERYATEELGPDAVTPGTRQNADYWRQKGRDYINAGQDPRMPIRAAVAGHVSPRNVGIVSAEYERLTQNRRQAADLLEQRPSDPQAQQGFQAADQAARAWRQEMQPVMTRGGEAMAAMQGEHPVDPTTFDGLHQMAMDANGGKEPTPVQKAELMKRAGVGRKLRTSEGEAVAARDAIIQKTLPKARPATPEMVADMVKRMTPCG